MELTLILCIHSKTKLHDDLFIRCLEYLSKQTKKDYILLINFDNCHESTFELFKDKIQNNELQFINYQVVISSGRAIGHANAKNTLIPYITTKYTAFQDADDFSDIFRLEKQFNYMMENPDVDILGCLGYNFVDNNLDVLNEVYPTNKYTTDAEIKNIIHKENCIINGSAMLKTDVLHKLNGYNPHLKYGEDWDFWVRGANLGLKFHILQERLYYYSIGTTTSF